MIFLTGLLGGVGTIWAKSVDLEFLVRVPNATTGLQVFLAGNFQGWNPGNPDQQLTDLGNGLYGINLKLETGQTLEFKFTRGQWTKVEKGPSGEEIANRIMKVTQSGTHRFQVQQWSDQHPAAQAASTISGDVRLLEIPEFLDGRQVRVWLPAEYTINPHKKYPVLYMFDGQNVFDAATSFVGEWRVDETCEELIAQGKIRPIIVVAVDHGRSRRMLEYTPWKDPQYKNENGEGAGHLDSINKHLVPFINQSFRTLTGPRNTGLAGSSLGGLMTRYAAGNFESTFGLLAAMSPSLWWNDRVVFSFAEKSIGTGIRLYLDMGGKEDEWGDGLGDLRQLTKILEGNGFLQEQNLMVVEDAPGRHNETAWARRLPAALMFLFPPEKQEN